MSKNRLRWGLFVLLGCLLIAPSVAGAAIGTVLNFDDITTSAEGWAVLPTNYGGFAWSTSGLAGSQWEVIANATGSSAYRGGYNNTFDFPSNPNAIYNGSPTPGYGAPTATIVSSATPFNFVGAYFSPWTNDDFNSKYGATQITVTGKLGDSTVSTQNISLTPGALVWKQLDINNIDSLIFTATANTDGYRLFVMDNFTVTPIPGAVWLLGSGLVGLIGLRRRAVKKAL